MKTKQLPIQLPLSNLKKLIPFLLETFLFRIALTTTALGIVLVFFHLKHTSSVSLPFSTNDSNNIEQQLFGNGVRKGYDSKDNNSANAEVAHSNEFSKGSICFILGEDLETGSSQFYTSALHFYSQPSQRSHYEDLVTECRTLLEVRNYLERHTSTTNQPWETIEIIVHSNEWTGLSAAIFPNGPRTSIESLEHAVDNGFEPLNSSVINKETELIIQSCAMGKNKKLLKKLGKLFAGNQKITVTASNYFVHFETEFFQGKPVHTDRSLLDYSYAFYKTGYKPGTIRLANQFKKRYPNKKYDWRKAIELTEPQEEGGVFHNAIRIPIRWTVTFNDTADIPTFDSKEAEQTWVLSQKPLKKLLQSYELSQDLFRWNTKSTIHKLQDGTKVPALKIYGDCTALVVLKTVSNKEESNLQTMNALSDRPFHNTSVVSDGGLWL